MSPHRPMDYTTLANVKAALGATLTVSDAQLSAYVTRASRMVDRLLTGRAGPDSDDYLQAAPVTDELIRGRYNDGRVLTYPRKPVITAITAAAYRATPAASWTTADTASAIGDGGQAVLYVTDAALKRGALLWVTITYTGGLAADVASLPADIVEQTTALAARLYREAQAGLSDVIGVNEMGVLMYSKAWPVRVREALLPYQRVAPWSGSL